MAEIGKLAQTMKKYAADQEVNITLRDITATRAGSADRRFPNGRMDADASGRNDRAAQHEPSLRQKPTGGLWLA